MNCIKHLYNRYIILPQICVIQLYSKMKFHLEKEHLPYAAGVAYAKD